MTSPAALASVLDRPRLPALDGVRAIAVTLVMAAHVGVGSVGGLGVTIFFVLSGFLITWLLIKEYDAAGTVSLRAFYLRRALRILPAYYVFLALSLAMDWRAGDGRSVRAALPAVFYYLNYYNALHGHPTSSIAHAWSLAVEEQFYLLWPAVFVLLAARGQRALAGGLVAALAAVMAWRSIAYAVLGLGSAYAYDAFDCRFDCLAAGSLLAVACRSRRFVSAVDGCARRWQGWPLGVACALVLASELTSSRLRYTIGFTAEALVIAFAISQLLLVSARLPWRGLDAGPVRYLGRVSYGMYLYHLWGLGAGAALAGAHTRLALPAGFLATVGFASISHYAIERPFLALRARLSAGGRAPRLPALSWSPSL
jgi:peptidoglycan/LPS O-acetylase OafA/YrhL